MVLDYSIIVTFIIAFIVTAFISGIIHSVRDSYQPQSCVSLFIINPIIAMVLTIITVWFLGSCQASAVPAKLVFAGRIVNDETGEWPNDRLVLAFLKGQELGRTVTKTGEFAGSGLGVHDGLYEIVTDNTYKVTMGQLNAALSAVGAERFQTAGDTAFPD